MLDVKNSSIGEFSPDFIDRNNSLPHSMQKGSIMNQYGISAGVVGFGQ